MYTVCVRKILLKRIDKQRIHIKREGINKIHDRKHVICAKIKVILKIEEIKSHSKQIC